MHRVAVAPADVLRAIGSESRLRALHLLQGRELCVCELVDVLGRPHYAVSRDLAALQDAGFIHARREGSWVYHSIAADAVADPFLGGLLGLIERRLADIPRAMADRDRLERRLSLRVGERCVVAVADLPSPTPVRPELFPGGSDGERRDL